ncbi:MAG: 2-oxoacid:acceptor oxidoreductase family protein [Kosmotogaceae bacterium]
MDLKLPHSVRISGIGGQGNVLMGIILAEALVNEGFWVIQTQSYGAQVRGGLSHCDVIFCKNRIDYPMAQNFDIIYSMHQMAVNNHASLIKTNGVLIVDSSFVNSMPKEAQRTTRRIIAKPITKMTQEKFDTSIPANMVGLGLISKATKIVSVSNLKKAMKKHVKESYYEVNEKALDFGYSLIERAFNLKDEERHEFVGRGFE